MNFSVEKKLSVIVIPLTIPFWILDFADQSIKWVQRVSWGFCEQSPISVITLS